MKDSWFAKFVEYIFSIFFPKRCVVCGKYGQLVCFECASKIELIKTSVCQGCGKISPEGKYCGNCRRNNGFVIDGVLVSARYDNLETKKIIAAFKYDGITELCIVLSTIMYERIKAIKLPKETLIIPVPLHKKRLKTRGFNQSYLLAQQLSMKLVLPLLGGIVRKKETHQQVGLDRSHRIRNMEDAFVCKNQLSLIGKTILLIDDVVTTGATLNACAKALKGAGAKKVIALVVAKN
ncbi:MAG: ComF family protein [Candidatus Berkelbacteria bacterium]|nr:ComF family protein [Candidatus Berkelbacteria bacterium]